MIIGIEFRAISNGGGERILYMLAKSFARYGHTVVILSWNPAWIHEVIDFPHELYILKKSPEWGNGLSSVRELSKVVKKFKIDCLVSFLNTPLRVFIGAARLNNIPVITSLRIEPKFPTFVQKLMKMMIWCCDGAVFQTQTVRNTFKGRIFKNSIVIHNPIMDDNLPIAHDSEYNKEIVGIGRLTEQKNFALLVDAFAEVNPKDYTLKIYGEGHLRGDLEKQIERLGMQDKIFLMGRVDRVVDHIVDSDIFVLSSVWEGMPNALMESMAMGLACIATDVPTGGCRDLIVQGENGLLVPVQDKENLKNALIKVINNEELKNKMKRKGMKIRESHSKDVIIPQWLSFIESKCRQRKGNK